MERYAPRYDPRALTFLQMATSAVGVHRDRPVARRARGAARARRSGARSSSPGVFAGALGYLIATWVQARTTAARAALVFTLEAPFAALAGVLLADEVLGWAGWLGCAVMMAGILVAEPAAAATLRRLLAPRSRRRVTPILLGCLSAFLFGAMTVLVRIALGTGVSPLAGTLFTIFPPASVTGVVAVAHGEWNVASAWPFVLAGLLAPGVAQILFTFARPRRGRLAHVGHGRDGPAVRGRDGARLPRRAARRRARRSARR